MTTYTEVLRNREFRALLVAATASGVGDQLTRVALTVLVFERSGSALLSAAVFAVVFLPGLLGGPLLGALSDRLPARGLLVGADLVRAALVLVMATAPLPVVGLLALLLVVETVTVPFDTAKAALVPELLDGDAFVVGSGLEKTLHQLCQVAGFGLGGLLLVVVPAQTALMLDAGTFALSGLLLAVALRRRPARATAGGTSLVADASAGLQVVLRTPRVRLLLVIAWVGCALLVVPEGLAAAYVAEVGGSAASVGLLLAAGPVGSCLGSVVVTRLVPAHRRQQLLLPLLALCAVPMLGAAARPSVVGLAVLLVLSGAGAACLVLASTTVAREVEPAVRGRVFGIASSGLMTAQCLAVLGGGALAGAVPVHAALTLTGAAGLLLWAWLAVSWRAVEAPAGRPVALAA